MSARSRGFTLIELLVVIVIIATLAGMALLSLGGSDSRQWTGEVQRFAQLLQLVADRALIDRAHYGVVMEMDGYKVVRFDPAAMKWEPLERSTTSTAAARLANHQLPENMRLEVVSAAEMPSSAPAEFEADQGSHTQPIPQFVALSSGEVLPVEVAVVLLRDGQASRSASISYTSLSGLQLEWQADDY